MDTPRIPPNPASYILRVSAGAGRKPHIELLDLRSGERTRFADAQALWAFLARHLPGLR